MGSIRIRRTTARHSERAEVQPRRRSSFEADIVLSSGHELWLGEATSSTDLQPLDRLDQLGELSDLLSAYEVMLATSTSGFKNSVRTRFGEVFDGLWPKVEIVNEVKRAA